MAQRLGVPKGLADWRALLAQEGADVISLAVPARAQVEIGLAALAAGKHVFFEKPLADTLTSAEALSRSAREHGGITAVNFEFPEVHAWQEAKRLLDETRIGPLRHVAVTWRVETYANRERVDTWKARSAEGGGALNLFASHSLYYVEWMFGRISSVSATLQRASSDERAGDTFDAMHLVTERGLPIALTIATDAFLGPGHRVEAYGDGGTLVLENRESDYVAGFQLMLATRGDDEYRLIPTTSPRRSPTEDGRIETTAAVARRFIDSIANGRGRPTPGVVEGVRVQGLMEAARLSSQTGRVVAVAA